MAGGRIKLPRLLLRSSCAPCETVLVVVVVCCGWCSVTTTLESFQATTCKNFQFSTTTCNIQFQCSTTYNIKLERQWKIRRLVYTWMQPPHDTYIRTHTHARTHTYIHNTTTTTKPQKTTSTMMKKKKQQKQR